MPRLTAVDPTAPGRRPAPDGGSPTPARRHLPTYAVKAWMAISGLVWAAFVLVHLYGNLKVWAGAEAFNSYAHWLREAFYPVMPPTGVLWVMRVVLVAALLAHVAGGFLLWSRARRARGPHRVRGAGRRGVRMALAAAMLPTGLVVLTFLVLHVLDLTVGQAVVAPQAFTPPTPETSSAYENLVASLGRPWMGLTYALAMLGLAAHLVHGIPLATSDLGGHGPRIRRVASWVAVLAAVAILVGNAAIPIGVMAGVLA